MQLTASPSICLCVGLTMEKYIQDNPLEGSYCVESLFQAVRFLEHLHRKIQSGCGAFSGESKS